MKIPRTMAISRIDSPLKLTVTYVLFGLVWIVGSDALVAWRMNEGIGDWLVDSAKGLLFIAVTGGLLYILVRRLVERSRTAESALLDSQRRWMFALEGAGDGMWDWNLQTDEMFYSERALALFGYRREDIRPLLSELLERVHPEHQERVQQQLQRHLAGETPAYASEYLLRCKDGTYKWALGRGQVIARDGDRRPTRMIGVISDITDRKAAEAQMAETLAFAQTVLQASPVGIVTFEADGLTATVNPALERMVGAEPGQMAGQNFHRLKSWADSGLYQAAQRALAEGREVEHQAELLTSFGRRLWIDARLVPFQHQGQTRLMAIISDETKSRQALANLHVLMAGLEAMPNGVMITNRDGLIEWVNAGFTTLTGYSREEAIGGNPRIMRSSRQNQEFYANLWSTIAAGRVWQGELQNQRKDGVIYPEYMTIAPVRGAAGAITHFVAIKQDLTQMRQLEQQLTRTQRLESIGMLASGIAHDLNNVLTPILLSIELLKSCYPDTQARRFVDTVETAAKRGAGIVGQVLTFARGMDGGERTEVQPRYLIKDVVQLIEETFPRNIRIVYQVPNDVRPVLGDITQLHQVILNLAVNARDAMPLGGELTLAARNTEIGAADAAHPGLKPGPHVALVIADTGSGITPEVLEHMFEPFYTTKSRGKGTGLGLSTVYGIVRSHGGAIEVQTRLGQGTTFEVLLPVAPAALRAAVPAGAVTPRRGDGRRVLIVDDEESIRNVTAQVLAGHGFVPVTARDGAEGLRQFQRAPADIAVAIIDMMMPRMNGAQLTRAIRDFSPTLPVIISTGLMSAEAEPNLEPELRAMGIRDFLHKPYTEEALLQALARAMGPAEGTSP